MRRALLVLVACAVLGVGAAVLVATRASARSGGASAFYTIGSSSYLLGSGGSCQTVGGDFSVSINEKGKYFHLIWTPKAHGKVRTVAWRWTYVTNDAVIGAKIKFAHGRTRGTFSGLSTKGVRITGSFSCG